MKTISKRIGKYMVVSLILSNSLSMAASGIDETYKNLTLEERLYLFDGYGNHWGIDVGNKGLWLVPERPISNTYTAPFKLSNNTLENTLVIGSKEVGMEGNVGIGTDLPQAKLDIRGNAIINGELNTTKAITAAFEGATTKQAFKLMDISVNNTNPAARSDIGFAMTNAREGFSWSFRTWEDDHGFAISKFGNGGTKEFRLYDTDPADATTVVLELGNGASNIAGQWLDASSRAYKENIKDLDTQTAMEAFHKLQPVTYNYKTNKGEPIVGFIAEDVPDVVATKDRDALSALEMVALLTKVVQVQEKSLTDIAKERKNLKETQLRQEKRISKLESLLLNLALDHSKDSQEKLSFSLK